MNPTMYQFLAEDHTRTLHRRARAARPVELARQAWNAPGTDRLGQTGPAPALFVSLRRLVHRLAAT